MSSHTLSYQLMMPVNVPQVNATTTVAVLINALSIGPIISLPDSPTSILLPPSLAGWLWPSQQYILSSVTDSSQNI